MTPEEVDVSIKWPFKWCLVGSSGSGKTQFALDVITKAFRLFDTPPSKVIIVYKEFQDIYTKFNDYIPTTLYQEDDIDLEDITKMNRENLLIIGPRCPWSDLWIRLSLTDYTFLRLN